MAYSKTDKKIHPDSIISKPANNVAGGVPRKKFAYSEIQGKRPTQEDALAWHPLTTELLSNSEGPLTPVQIAYRLWTSNQILDVGAVLAKKTGGSTVSTTVYDGRGNLITSTLGDAVSFAVVYDKKGAPLGAVRLNKVTHKPTNPEEVQRIEKAGGFVSDERVNGYLGVSRSIGDKGIEDFRAQIVTSESSIDINNVDALVKDLKINPMEMGSIQIITTCDGFTEPADYNKHENHVTYLLRQLAKIKAPGLLNEQTLAQQLTNLAWKEGSQDNISVAIQTLERDSPFFLGVYDGHGGNEVSHFVADNIGTVFLEQCSLSAQDYYEQPLSIASRFENFARDNVQAENYETKLPLQLDVKENIPKENPSKNSPPKLEIKEPTEAKEQQPLSVKWVEIPGGNYNKIYKGMIDNQPYVLKIQKEISIPGKAEKYKSPTDTPERSVKLWNLINPKIPARDYTDSRLGKGWICPFIQGKQASDKEISKELLAIFNRTKRIIMDAPGKNNFLKTPDHKIVCVDIGMALRLEHVEVKQLLAQNPEESIVSGKVWSQLSDTYDIYFKENQKKFPETVATLKALIFIKNNSEIHNAKALEGKHALIKEFAQAYDLQKCLPTNAKVTAALDKLHQMNPPTIENLKKSCVEELNIYINSRGTIENGTFKASSVTNFFRNKILTGQKVKTALDLIKEIESPSSTPEQIKDKVEKLLNDPTMVRSRFKSGMQLCLVKCSNILDQEPCDLVPQSSVSVK